MTTGTHEGIDRERLLAGLEGLAGLDGCARRGPGRACARAREPHRRAHRLQRRLRPAGGHRPRDRHRVHAHGRRTGDPDPGRDRRDRIGRRRRGRSGRRAPGPTTSRAPRARWRVPACPSVGFRGLLASTLPEGAGLSSSAALELASAWALSPAGGPGRVGPRDGTHRPAGRERVRGHALRAHGPVRLGLWRGRWRRDARLPDAGAPNGGTARGTRHLRHPLRRAPEPGHVGLQRASRGLRACRGRRPPAGARGPRPARCRPGHARRAPPTWIRSPRCARGTSSRRTTGCCRTIDALAANDLAAVGELFAASHASLRDLFEVSCPELDLLVDISAATPGVVAARMTGAGFGGCIVALVMPDAVDDLWARIERDYPERPAGHPGCGGCAPSRERASSVA